jgi:hypothetical protein
VSGIIGNLQRYLRNIRAFRNGITILSRRHLNSDYLNELIQAGPDAAGPIVAELVRATGAQIHQVNVAEKGIKSTAQNLGDVGADIMYNPGQQIGKGFLSGLKSEEKAIEAEMEKIAGIVVKTVDKELGIHSPSTVLRYRGLQSGIGYGLGLDDSTARVRAAASRMAAAAVPAMRLPGVSAPVRGGDGMTLTVTYDGPQQGLIREIVTDLRYEISAKSGGDVQRHLGQGKART